MGVCFSSPPPPSAGIGADTIIASTSASFKSAPAPAAAPPAPLARVDPKQFKSEDDFKRQYQMRGVLGEGSYSVVRKATDNFTNAQVAIKVVDRKKLTPEDEVALRIEVEILAKLRHAHVIQLYDWYGAPSTYYLALEYMQGGELFERIVQREFYSEYDAKEVVLVLTRVLQYLHVQHKICHRDLKPENILLASHDSSNDADGIKIADFGFAKPFGNNELTSACGTPGYVAPEIISGKSYGASVDVWSVGVITFILLCGYPPFYSANQKDLFKLIREGRFKFESPYWDKVSGDAKEFITNCLKVHVADRYTVNDMLQSKWLVQEAKRDDLRSALLELKKFNARRKLRAAIKAAIAANRMADIAAGVRSFVSAQKAIGH
ncbi:hypothetical protein BASA81_016247 [Batrachochytrium salamandrivorans]|nr:hypothetical protein BASA81_016247 [Batrachochytrium salamandrivorans]